MKLLSSNLRLHLTLWLAWTNENFSENVIYDLVAHDINASNKQFKTSIGKLQKLINQLACCGVTNDPTKSPSFSPTENEAVPSTTPSASPSMSPSASPSMSPSASSHNPSTSVSPSLSSWPSVSPSLSSWRQVGDDVDGGFSIALSKDGQRLWTGGLGELRLYGWSGGAWVVERDFSSSVQGDNYVYSISIISDGDVFAASVTDIIHDASNALVFREDESGWAQEGSTLTGENVGEFFGSSVSLNGDGTVLAVGAVFGSYVKIFNYNENDWMVKHKITGDDNTWFGISVCLSADATRLIVGSPQTSNNELTDSGSIYFYSLSPYEQQLERMDGNVTGGYFGKSVSMSRDGSVVAAGSDGGDYVKLLKATDSSLQQYQQVGATIHGPVNSSFGLVFLSPDGNRLVVTAPYYDQRKGKVFVYAIDDDGHRLVGEILGDKAWSYFGSSVGMAENVRNVAVGTSSPYYYSKQSYYYYDSEQSYVRVFKR